MTKAKIMETPYVAQLNIS